MVIVDDTDVTPFAVPQDDGGGGGGGGGGLSSAQQAALATLQFLQDLQDSGAFGEDAVVGLPVGGMGIFTNSSTVDFSTTGGTSILPADFSNTGDLGGADFGLIIDYNRDQMISSLDIDALYDHVGETIDLDVTTILDAMFDLTLDSVVDQDDVDVLVMGFFGTDYGDLKPQRHGRR